MHPVFAGLMILACLPAHDAWAANTVEFPASSRTYVGTLGNKAIEASLWREDRKLTGSYCYQPCSNELRQQLRLDGRVAGYSARLTETDGGKETRPVTGIWQLTLTDDGATGSWSAPHGARTLPIRLQSAHAFPFEVKVVADKRPGNEDCGDPPHVSAIRLYRKGRLVHTLPTSSDGTCEMFSPQVLDANFDGLGDLSIAEQLPAGPNVPYQTWLFDRARQGFVAAPATLQGITSPEFDSKHQTIVTSWRNGCCEHGVTTYRWHGKQLKEHDSASSEVLAVLDGDTRRYCYAVPYYLNGRIEQPDRVELVGDRLQLSFTDFSGCETSTDALPNPHFNIWQRGADGTMAVVRSEQITWQKTSTPAGERYCPAVPYFSSGKIVHLVAQDQVDDCLEENPDR